MGDDKDSQAQAAADSATEDSIKVVCRFRPLNDTEEKAGSKFIIMFPFGSDDQCVSIAVSEYFGSIIMSIGQVQEPNVTTFRH